MANTKLGNHPSWAGQSVEKLDSTKQLGRSDSGKVFMIDNSGAFTINLPKISADIAGWNCKMINLAEGGAVVSVVANGVPAGTGGSATAVDADTVHYLEMSYVGGETGASRAASDGFTVGSAAIQGDEWDIFTDGTTWYVKAEMHQIGHGAHIDDA